MHSFLMLTFFSSFQLTWLADPALVTSVYPNRTQYAPHVLQEASLLDGVDASVCGNGRRFSKTSSYPPCCEHASCYARANLPRTVPKSYWSWLVANREESVPTCTVVSSNTEGCTCLGVYMPVV